MITGQAVKQLSLMQMGVALARESSGQPHIAWPEAARAIGDGGD